MTKQAINTTPVNHPYLAAYLNNLGKLLSERYSHTGTMVDLEQAIRATKQAINTTPFDHPDRAVYSNNLEDWFDDTKDTEIFTEDYLQDRKGHFEMSISALKAEMPPPTLEDPVIVDLLMKVQLLGMIINSKCA